LKPVARSLPDWLHYQEQLHPRSIDLGLERVLEVARRLGLLPLPCRSVIVGGTNGKGSTAAMIAAIAQAHGVDDERVAHPAADRVTAPRRLRIDRQRAAVGEDLPVARVELAQHRDEAGNLDDLLIVRQRPVARRALDESTGESR